MSDACIGYSAGEQSAESVARKLQCKFALLARGCFDDKDTPAIVRNVIIDFA